ncbi:MAG: type II secretion system protein [Gemmatimonadota bacterium]|jgi:prepilin-type N-terminal cleavage/methylation domain-containing protein
MRRGYTLLELMATLVLVAIVGPAVVGAGHGLRDRAAVVGAREAVAGLLAQARMEARSWGGARVHLRAEPWEAWVEAGGVVRRRVALQAEWGVEVALSRSRTETVIRYDALGLGRVASETLRFRRGDAGTALVVSGYGRVRRW